jgi:F420-dependent oxidoreductase-like protein
MRFCVFTEPQLGATYEQQVAIAQRTEALGFDGFFRSDHFLQNFGAGTHGPTDSWVTLGGLARETSRVRLGTLVTSATFRLPGPLAIAVAQVDAMSGGRIELGLGAGWFEAEHRAYGIPFPSARERFDRLEEQLAIVTGLWSTPAGETFSYRGAYYDLHESPALPKPVQQPGPPVIVGGRGKKRTPHLAATYADEFNVAFVSLEATKEQFARVAEACETIGRDAGGRAPLVFSVAHTIICGETEADAKKRFERHTQGAFDPGDGGIVGTPEQVAERLRAFRDIGARRAFLQVLDMTDLEHVDLIAAEVLPLTA